VIGCGVAPDAVTTDGVPEDLMWWDMSMPSEKTDESLIAITMTGRITNAAFDQRIKSRARCSLGLNVAQALTAQVLVFSKRRD
jgi:hypothetical protein